MLTRSSPACLSLERTGKMFKVIFKSEIFKTSYQVTCYSISHTHSFVQEGSKTCRRRRASLVFLPSLHTLPKTFVACSHLFLTWTFSRLSAGHRAIPVGLAIFLGMDDHFSFNRTRRVGTTADATHPFGSGHSARQTPKNRYHQLRATALQGKFWTSS